MLPAPEVEFPGQLKQVVLSIAIAVAEYWQARHLMQVLTAVAPCVPEYLPAPQFVQVLATVAPTVPEYVLAPQSVHMAEPVSVLYFPATQAVHVALFVPEYPRLQRQAVASVCAKSACPEFARQD